MKGFIIFLVIVVALCCALLIPSNGQTYFRIHIRADGNDNISQSVKYEVKDAVVDYLIPILAECDTLESAEKAVRDNLSGIEKTADYVLAQNGCNYTSKAEIKSEVFPTRTYGNITLVSGVYQALVLNLGSGQGENWWCVIYPPLCFVGGTENGTNDIVYRSKILEIIKSFYGSED